MDESAILCTCNSSNKHLASPRAMFLLLCNFFPNHTLIHVITYTNGLKPVVHNMSSEIITKSNIEIKFHKPGLLIF